MIWFSADGLMHPQEPGQLCAACGVRHRLSDAAVSLVCCGPAHGWPKVGACVFCGGRWKVPGDAPWTERFTPLAPLG